jgi:DNA end-binding protein Ku
MKALWKGNISFALVNIPVKLYGAAHKKDLSFHLLHKKCSSPLQYERYCPVCKADVAWEDTVHGYEYEKNKFVVLTDEEIEHIPIKTSKSIDILRFIDAKEIDSIYYDRAYYLEPVEGGERAYALLRETMKETGKLALAKITFKNREHVSILRVYHDLLLLQTLLYTDDIVNPETVNIPKKISLDDKELSLATELIRHFLGKFNIDSYHDGFRDALMGLIKAKIAGKEIKVAPKKEAEKVISLMDALKKSLAKGAKKKAG